MIWVAGRIVRDDELSVSVLDRTFEHGLGLFETLRTWAGKAPLLSRHIERLRSSASALGLPIDMVSLPDEDAVSALMQSEGAEGDMMLRIVLSGGRSATAGSVAWMRALPLPPPLAHRDGAVVCFGEWAVVYNDTLARHKALNYWDRRLAYEHARSLGFDETLSMTSRWHLWEGSRTNLFVLLGDSLITPSTKGPIVPGIVRGIVLEQAKLLPLNIIETEELTYERMRDADEVFLTNSVRGMVPVRSAHCFGTYWSKTPKRWPAPGPWTQRLALLLADHLNPEGGPTA